MKRDGQDDEYLANELHLNKIHAEVKRGEKSCIIMGKSDDKTQMQNRTKVEEREEG